MFYINPNYKTDSRFDAARFSEYNVDIYDTLQSYIWTQIPRMQKSGNFVITNEVGRPDIVAHRIYGTTALWWVIMSYNGLFKHPELVSGLNIAYPSKADIDALYLSLAAKQASV